MTETLDGAVQAADGRALPQPYAYRHNPLVEPEWRRFPGWKDVTDDGVALGAVAALALREEHRAAARCSRRPRRRTVLRRHRGRHRPCRDHVDAAAAADAQHDGVLHRAVRRRLAHRCVLRRSGSPLHAAGVLRPAYGVDQPPARHARLAARARDVGGRGAHPPLPDQGARRAAAHLPAVLRPLHAHGPRRQLDPQVEKLKFIAKPDARLSEMLDYLRGNPGVRDVVVSGGDVANLPWNRLESFVAALLEIDNIRDIRLASKALMGLPQHWLQDDVRAGHGAPGDDGPRARRRSGDPHARQRGAVRHPAGCRGHARDVRGRRARRTQPGRPDAWSQRVGRTTCSTCASRCSMAPGSCRTTSTCAT